jgi:hypothetical protein
VLAKSTLLSEPLLQSILLWLFWRWASCKLLAQAGLEPSSSWDYRREPLVPGLHIYYLMDLSESSELGLPGQIHSVTISSSWAVCIPWPMLPPIFKARSGQVKPFSCPLPLSQRPCDRTGASGIRHEHFSILIPFYQVSRHGHRLSAPGHRHLWGPIILPSIAPQPCPLIKGIKQILGFQKTL